MWLLKRAGPLETFHKSRTYILDDMTAPILFYFHSISESLDPIYFFMREAHSLEDAP
jgi:hypothetical protein